MQYYRNIDVSKKYHVSLTAVAKWIDAAKQGRIELQLHQEGQRVYIANTAKNQLIMDELARERKKFINSRSRKTVRPSARFYELYNEEEIFDIIANIEKHREIPLQYAYFDGGADFWDKYMQKLLNDTTPNTLTSTIKLLELAQSSITTLIGSNKRVNVVDLGVGNAMPVHGLLSNLLRQGLLNRYVAIDDSKAMLDIAEQNIKEWFDDKVNFEGHVRDILTDRFDDLLARDSFDGSNAMNVVLLLGGTLSNLRNPEYTLELIHRSMGRNDLLVFTRKLDTPRARTFFDFNPDDSVAPLPPRHKMIPDLLNIDESFYDVEQLFDTTDQARYIRIRMKVTLSIIFEIDGRERTVTLEKGDALLLWRARHQNTFDVIRQFDRNNFELLNASKTRDNEYILLIYEVKDDTAR
ncbi:MAG TPA: L-histidine N(alpha)-methyltransferase [Verrucomicrobiae bacterium]|nr:L-histidine N(alpha)-methyltransferase [Verrucomicrobiae bacterium]